MAEYNYVRLQQYGTMANAQTWSVGLGVEHTQATPISAADLTTWLTALDTALKAWWTTGSGLQSCNYTDIKYVGARAYSYAITQNVAFAQADHPFTTPLLGTAGAGTLPVQTCLVASTLSGSPGRSFRGRRYLPLTSCSLAVHNVSTTNTDAILAGEVALLNAINSTALGSGTAKATIVNKKTTPARIFSVRVDSEPDIQRRRADKLVALYSKTTALA
jgi:hypothetical protein